MLYSRLHPHTGTVITGADRTVYDAVWFEALFIALDRLHDRVCEAQGCEAKVGKDANSVSRIGIAAQDGPVNMPVLPLEAADMVGWLEDIIYTAQETISEIRENLPDAGVTTAEGSACTQASEGGFRDGRSQ